MAGLRYHRRGGRPRFRRGGAGRPRNRLQPRGRGARRPARTRAASSCSERALRLSSSRALATLVPDRAGRGLAHRRLGVPHRHLHVAGPTCAPRYMARTYRTVAVHVRDRSEPERLERNTRDSRAMLATAPIAIVGSVTGDFRLGAAVALYLIAAGFAAMAIVIVTIRLPEMRRATGRTLLHDIADGLGFVAAAPHLPPAAHDELLHRLLRAVLPVAAARVRG